MQPVNVVILAAGQGNRMRSPLPKVLHRLAGRPLITHVLDVARALKPQRICVVYGHGGEALPQAVRAPDLAFVRQEPQLGTGHALAQALPQLSTADVTLVLYGDVPLIELETLQAMLDTKRQRVTILTTEAEDPAGYGRVVRDRRGAVRAIVEDKDASAAQRCIREINTGIMALPTRRLKGWLSRIGNRNTQREYYLTDIVALALKDKVPVATVSAHAAREALGVNSKTQLAQVERAWQWRHVQRLMDQGVTLADPMRVDVRGELTCGEEVRIDINCVFEGRVSLGDGVVIGANCVLKDSEIGAGTRIEPFTLMDDAKIGERCRIGPYARLRPGNRIGEEVHIGNFVEVKASEIRARSKANHLAYIGDTTVGRDVNIGAGTIICNYDGANKHRTVIEDEVHIGSDVQLVAPVTVARGSTVGAGTTVWKDTPPGGLVINPKSQEYRPGWKRPKKAVKGDE
ncbi:MAG: bifunctional UDP-N-acetylglucosamine diphosphorylase/glucosamine-1-phosphate N-acetyltransferase GlmU [Betaproteobacteria bacterium]|nr:bifunctional UDP-N-acetylglucosamine diphosphorylase/glucosamine-1-phosphate N-acetyltransferase GlmU [Betaproteobacteria bacterium]MDH3436097.1 bifunctional UDP-N-acetylglucosamine diphosphorylase/glucosamine-1-phosphate N-acetyltransferase GlmU [Betaproteobacteria bacterium]